MTKESKIADAIKTASATAEESGGMTFGVVEFVDINPKNIELAKRAKTGGRKKKEDADKATETVTLKITPNQMLELKKLAAVAPVSTYVKYLLKLNGYITD